MDQVEKVIDEEVAAHGSKDRSEHDLYETSITYEDLLEMMPKAHKGDSDSDVKIVSEFIRFMMTKWAGNLSERSEGEKSSVMGKRETTIYTQTRLVYVSTGWKFENFSAILREIMLVIENPQKSFFFRAYLKPLLRLLKKQTVTDDVLDSLVKMVVLCLQREYIFSHEAYMEMAVGNAPWPIGKRIKSS